MGTAASADPGHEVGGAVGADQKTGSTKTSSYPLPWKEATSTRPGNLVMQVSVSDEPSSRTRHEIRFVRGDHRLGKAVFRWSRCFATGVCNARRNCLACLVGLSISFKCLVQAVDVDFDGFLSDFSGKCHVELFPGRLVRSGTGNGGCINGLTGPGPPVGDGLEEVRRGI